jgi:hypothetical protein
MMGVVVPERPIGAAPLALAPSARRPVRVRLGELVAVFAVGLCSSSSVQGNEGKWQAVFEAVKASVFPGC